MSQVISQGALKAWIESLMDQAHNAIAQATGGDKLCFGCREAKPISEFMNVCLGQNLTTPYCHECRAEQQQMPLDRWLAQKGLSLTEDFETGTFYSVDEESDGFGNTND